MTTDTGLEGISQDSRNVALLVWIGTIFFGFIPGLIVYLIKKDDPYVIDQSKEALNWSITAIIGYCVGVITTFILIGFLVLFVIGICHLLFCVLGAAAGSSRQTVPRAVRDPARQVEGLSRRPAVAYFARFSLTLNLTILAIRPSGTGRSSGSCTEPFALA